MAKFKRDNKFFTFHLGHYGQERTTGTVASKKYRRRYHRRLSAVFQQYLVSHQAHMGAGYRLRFGLRIHGLLLLREPAAQDGM